jgi:ribonuclease R
MKKPHGIRNRDPYLERERARYDKPLPSREFILEVLTEVGVPLQDTELIKMLEIRRTEIATFMRRLAAMEREGQILRNRKGSLLVAQKIALISGRVEAHPDGFGFFIPDSQDGDLYLGPREMLKVMHRDRVMVRESGLDRLF